MEQNKLNYGKIKQIKTKQTKHKSKAIYNLVTLSKKKQRNQTKKIFKQTKAKKKKKKKT